MVKESHDVQQTFRIESSIKLGKPGQFQLKRLWETRTVFFSIGKRGQQI